MKTRINILGTMFLTAILTGRTVSFTMSTSALAELAMFPIQKTDKSMQDPLPGHETHQIAIALPPRTDGKKYSRQVTYSASKPVEVVVLNPFNATATDKEQGELLNAPFGKGSVAISVMNQFMEN